MKKVNRFNSELNRFVYENCRKNIVVQDIDMLIRYYDDSNKFRAIEKKHLNESLGKGQKITLIELTKHNIEAFVVFGNAPYKQDNYIYSLHTFNLYKVDSNTLIKFFNNHIEEGGLGKHWVANNKNLYKLSDSVEIEPYNSFNKKNTRNDLAELMPPDDFNDGLPPMDADYFPSDLDFEANFPPDVTDSPVNENENLTVKNNYIDLNEEDIVFSLMIYGMQYFQVKQNGAIEEWNFAAYVLSDMEDIIDDFESSFHKRIIDRIYKGLEDGKIYTLKYFIEDDDEDIKNFAIELSKSFDIDQSFIIPNDRFFATLPKLYGNDKIDVITGINLFKMKRIQRLYEKNQKALRRLSTDDIQGMQRLLKVQQRLMNARKSIAEKTDTVVLK